MSCRECFWGICWTFVYKVTVHFGVLAAARGGVEANRHYWLLDICIIFSVITGSLYLYGIFIVPIR